MAAFAAALVDFPVVAVPRGVGTSAVPLFTRSALSHGVRWKTLAAESGSESLARVDLANYLAAVDLTQHPPPVAPELATILVAWSEAGMSRRGGSVPATLGVKRAHS